MRTGLQIPSSITIFSLTQLSCLVFMSNKNQLTNELAAIKIQRQWRSMKRYQLHQQIFQTNPDKYNNLSLINFVPDKRLRNIIHELTAMPAIINNKVYHWTTISNLKNILHDGYLYGNQYLSHRGIKFDKNTLSPCDISNGDGNVICLSPCLVDPTLFDKNGQLKKELVRLTLDLNNLDQVNQFGHYNQFAKIYDLRTKSYEYRVQLNDKLSITFFKSDYLSVEILFNDVNYTAVIPPEDDMFYGNLYSINRFCLLKVFELINKAEYRNPCSIFPDGDKLPDVFYPYLYSLNDDDIKKFVTTFAQGLTIFSEYNFNCALRLSDNLITEIYSVDDETLTKITPAFSKEDNNEKQHYQFLPKTKTWKNDYHNRVMFFSSDIRSTKSNQFSERYQETRQGPECKWLFKADANGANLRNNKL